MATTTLECHHRVANKWAETRTKETITAATNSKTTTTTKEAPKMTGLVTVTITLEETDPTLTRETENTTTTPQTCTQGQSKATHREIWKLTFSVISHSMTSRERCNRFICSRIRPTEAAMKEMREEATTMGLQRRLPPSDQAHFQLKIQSQHTMVRPNKTQNTQVVTRDQEKQTR